MANTNEIFITVDDMCEMMAIGKNTAYELLSSGEVQAFKIGRIWKIPKFAIDQYVNRKIAMQKPFTRG